MVIIKDYLGDNYRYFPKNKTNSNKNLKLTIKSLITQKSFHFDVTDDGNMRDYYKIDITQIILNEGEYEYDIDGDKGLLIVGDYKVKRTTQNDEYKKEKVTYKQYNG